MKLSLLVPVLNYEKTLPETIERDRWRDSLQALRLPLRLPSWVSPSHLILLAILATGFGFYARTVGYWFFMDDFWFLRASQATPLGNYMAGAFNFRHQQYVPEFLYRPLYLLSFRGLYQVFGLHAWAYHLFNVTLHVASGALVWLIAVKITRRPIVGHLAALIFLLHPTYAMAVAFVTNGVVVISTFVYLSSLLLYLCYLDGGARRRVYYGASFLAFVAALLLHPETSYLFALLALSYVLLRANSFRELRSVGAWAQFVPFLLIEIALLITQALARDANPLQSAWFKLGPHMLGNYARYTALALDPYRAPASKDVFTSDRVSLSSWRTLLPVTSGVAAGALLLFFERKRPRAGTFALLWLVLALLPLSTWTAGAFARKLYGAGPGLALAVAIFAVSAWDLIPARLQAGLRYLMPTHLMFLLVMIPMGMRVMQISDAFNEDSQSDRYVVEQVRHDYPTLPGGGRLYLVGVPWTMLTYGGGCMDCLGWVSAIRLYYGDIEIIGVVSKADLARLATPPTARDAIVQFRCPPVCQPPLALAPISAQQTHPLPGATAPTPGVDVWNTYEALDRWSVTADGYLKTIADNAYAKLLSPVDADGDGLVDQDVTIESELLDSGPAVATISALDSRESWRPLPLWSSKLEQTGAWQTVTVSLKKGEYLQGRLIVSPGVTLRSIKVVALGTK